MERQSSRIYFEGKYHKDIYFQGHYHKAMYLTDSAGNPTLVWEKLGSQTEEFAFTILLTEDPCLFRLFLCGSVDVDWGDGSSSGVSSEELAAQGHWYRGGGRYTVRIRGELEDIGFISKPEVTRVMTAFPRTMNGKKDFRGMFSGCGIVAVPQGLFDNCPNATDFSHVFSGCGITAIPSGLFDNCPNANDFSSAFSSCYSIKEIPQGLFDNCPNATDFSGVFAGSDNIVAIPSGLFDNCPNATDFSHAFSSCYSIKEIPQGLFDNCPNASRFTDTFRYCKSVTSRVPELWETHPDASHSSCFLGCTSAANYHDIPNSWKNIF